MIVRKRSVVAPACALTMLLSLPLSVGSAAAESGEPVAPGVVPEAVTFGAASREGSPSLSCESLTWFLPVPADGWATPVGAASTEPSDYYAIELVPTGRVPGTRLSQGVAYATAAVSPFFGVAVSPTGEYLQDLDIAIQGLRPPASGVYVAWATDTQVSQVVRLGAFDESMRLRGQVGWNKFLVVVTREPGEEPTTSWQGPIVMRGMSRSGRMHTLAGHGPFEAEPCAKYGFR